MEARGEEQHRGAERSEATCLVLGSGPWSGRGSDEPSVRGGQGDECGCQLAVHHARQPPRPGLISKTAALEKALKDRSVFTGRRV